MFSDPYWDNVVLALDFAGANNSTTFTDLTGRHSLTAVGNAKISTAKYKFGGSAGIFDGTGDVVSIPDSADWDFGTGYFTIEGFVWFNSVAANQCILSQYDSTLGIIVEWYPTNEIKLYKGGSTLIASFPFTPTIGQIYHFAISSTGTNLMCFIDGIQSGSTVTYSTDFTGSTKPLVIGGTYFNGSYVYCLNGGIDDLRITKGVARYTTNFTVNTSSYFEPPSTISFYGPSIEINFSGGSSVAFESPAISVFMSGGSSTSFNAPYIEVSTTGGGYCYFDSPLIEYNANGGGYTSFNAPTLDPEIWPDSGKMSFKAPKTMVNASGGGYAHFKAPKEQVNITGTVNNNGTISFQAPRMRVNIDGTVDTIGWMSFPGPKMKVNITGKVGSVGSMSFPAPKIKMNMSGYSTAGDVSFSGPGMQVNMSGGLVHNYGILKYVKGQIR